jgi:translation initiation factor IF-3
VVLGDSTLSAALALAEERGLDLVEMSPGANPPVCKIMNYGKFRYKEQKKKMKSKSSSKKMKEIKMGINISDHDFDFKIKHAQEFLSSGHSARFVVSLRGREMRHSQLASALMSRVVERLADFGSLQDSPAQLGNKFISTFVPSLSRVKTSAPKKTEKSEEEGGSE